MDSVNELSCEFAATVFAKMKTSEQITPQDVVNLIHNFYNALHPLIEQNNRSKLEKYFSQKAPDTLEKSAASNH